MKKWYYKLKESENYNVLIGAVFISTFCLCILELIVSVTGVSIGLIRMHGAEGVDWARQLMLFRLAYAALAIGLFAGCLLLVDAACKKNSKFIFPAIALFVLIDVFSYGEAFAAGNCAIMAIVWFIVIRKRDADLLKWSKAMIVALVVVAMIKIPLIIFLEFHTMEGLIISDYIWEAVRLIGGCILNPEFILALLLLREQNGSSVGKALLKSVIAVWVIVFGAWLFSNVQVVLQEPALGYWSDEEPVTEIEEGDWSEWETEEDMQYYDEEGNGVTYQTFEFE
jgi:hypothetical protein